MGRRIVVVDNDAAVLDLLLLDLRLEGHEILATAMDGDQALQACEAHRPDVLVVDFRLGPGLNGLDVAERVQREGLRIVLHTNYVTPDVVKAAARTGVIVVEKGSLEALRRAVDD
ncbi:MAG TPA: response regulator [Acidimicrobiales bacterium]|jgi:CheY-like chemotaxis protein|nr:response regulator [Acidimicrobiales bacterium]